MGHATRGSLRGPPPVSGVFRDTAGAAAWCDVIQSAPHAISALITVAGAVAVAAAGGALGAALGVACCC